MTIDIQNLNKTYKGKVKALVNVSFSIPAGIFGLIGRNGAGKTTLMKAIATVSEADSGKILFDNNPISTHEIRSNLGYLPQDTKLIPHLNIYEFLDYMCVLKGIDSKAQRKDEIERCSSLVGLENQGKKRLGKFSGGMLRRAGIAQAIIGNPKLLIIDEPTTGLDSEERIFFLNLLAKISIGKTVIFSTHIIQDIENLCNNICVLEKGNVKYSGKADSLKNEIEGKLWCCEFDPEEEQAIKSENIVTYAAILNNKLVVRYVSDECKYDNSILVNPSLEDAYIHSLGGLKR